MLVGKPFTFQYVGLATARKNEVSSNELASTMTKIIADRTYLEIAAKWALTDYAVPKLVIDSANWSVSMVAK